MTRTEPTPRGNNPAHGSVSTELVSPAGNVEKLLYAWEYGADAAYIGIGNFSLRANADNFTGNDYQKIAALKNAYAAAGKTKKLFCALNISFHNDDIKKFEREIPYFQNYPFDAFIIQDLGVMETIQKRFPEAKLHLSTQANCINGKAVKAYRDLGFSRVVLGREVSLAEMREIKNAVPEMELECFVHGAMCIAYSGRCLLSAYLSGRSANSGNCAHSCRWEWRLYAEEKERRGDFFPVEQTENHTAIFSSKDLCMINHLQELIDAGATAFKIEGRMKSLYYTALTTQAYRKKIDSIHGLIPPEEAEAFAAELHNVPHRDFSTGFYFSREEADKTTPGKTHAPYKMAGTIGKKTNPRFLNAEKRGATDYTVPGGDTADDSASERDGMENGGVFFFAFFPLNKITAGEKLEYIGPGVPPIEDSEYEFLDGATGETLQWTDHLHPCILRTAKKIGERFIVRMHSV